jgi:phosphopantothenoylcysteine decarboxylase/phosphopantothenate--cysteine ligase
MSSTGELAGRNIIITNGPTAEQLTTGGDVITNFSSGKQGRAIADALSDMGAKVMLVTGGTARDMLGKTLAQLPADVFIGVAAVADFAIETPLDLQLKDGEPHALQLTQNPDILQTIGQHPTLRPKVVIGFAAETAPQPQLLEYARKKLERKGADAICANRVSAASPGSDVNQISWVSKNGAEPWEAMDKHAVGRAIGGKIVEMLGYASSV